MTLKREVIDYALPRGLIEPVGGGRVDASLAMMGNGDPEEILPLVDRVIAGTAPTPSKRRKLRITDGK